MQRTREDARQKSCVETVFGRHLEAPENGLDIVKVELPKLISQVAALSVPLVAEVGAGRNWEETH